MNGTTWFQTDILNGFVMLSETNRYEDEPENNSTKNLVIRKVEPACVHTPETKLFVPKNE